MEFLPYLSRLKPDGTVDASFNLGSGPNGKVYCSLIQPDGIMIAGSFTFNGIDAGRIIRQIVMDYDATLMRFRVY
jgi:hypothetical protein